ncbi:MAG: hypothetical protein ACJ76I_05575 [Gaiellaceae bacterium]
MKRLVLVAAILVGAVVTGAAPGAGCTPLDCAPSGVTIRTDLLVARPAGIQSAVDVVDLRTGAVKWHLPAGILTGHMLVQSASHRLTWHDAATGAELRTTPFGGNGFLVGTSQDGTRAVMAFVEKKRTTFTVVSSSGAQTVVLPGNRWGFDALSGNSFYLLKYLQNGYEIRRYDLGTRTLSSKPLKDPKGSSRIWGIAWSRLASADGRYLFTLYLGSDGGAMVHKLDLRTGAARCIDLQGSSDFNAGSVWTMQLSPNDKTLWAVNPAFGRVVGIDVARERVTTSFRFTSIRRPTQPSSSTSAISPDGSRIAVAMGGAIWQVSVAKRTVAKGQPLAAVALGFSPDGTTLWAVTKAAQVIALPVS